jgi:hypothetical protein
MSVASNDLFTLTLYGVCAVLVISTLLGTGVAGQEAEGTLTGTVENNAGENINGAKIIVTNDGDTTTTNNGAYTLPNIQYGVKNVSVHKNKTISNKTIKNQDTRIYEKKFQDNIVIDTGSTVTQDFTLDRATGEIEGRVIDGSSSPLLTSRGVAGATVEVYSDGDNKLMSESNRLSKTTTTNETGYFTIDAPTGNVDLEARTDGFELKSKNKKTNILVTQDGVSISPIDLDSETGEIEGTVTTESGDFINDTNVSVDIDYSEYPQLSEGDLRVKTNKNGYYKIFDVPDDQRTVVVDPPTFKKDQATVDVSDGGKHTQDFTLSQNKLDITSVSPSDAQSGDEIVVSYRYDEAVFNELNFTVEGQGQTLVEDTINVDGASAAEDISFTVPGRSSVSDGTYTITLETPRRTAKNTFTIANPVDPDVVGTGELGEESYRAPAGGFVDITTGGEYMLIGGDNPPNSGDGITPYLDVLYVEGGSTTINTRLMGTNVSSERAYGEGVKSYAHSIGANSEPSGDFADVSFQGASTLAEFRDNVGIDSRSVPLQTGRYRLLAGENGRITTESGIPKFRKPVGRSNLILTQPRLEAVNTYILPPEAANAEDVAGPSGDATESKTIANGERLLIEIQATGMYGATIDDPTVQSIPPNDVANLLQRHEGVDMDLSTWYYEDSDNTEADLQFADMSPSDVYILPDDTTDQWDDESVIGEDTQLAGLYVVVDTRGEAFTSPAYGDVMEFSMAYESPTDERYLYQDVASGMQPPPFDPTVEPDESVEHFPYFGESDTTVTVNSTVEFMEPSIQYGRTTVDNELIVPSTGGGQILGSTTMAPGTEATIQFIDQSRPDPELATIEEVTVEDDRTFTASADFSALDSGDEVTVEFYTAGRLPDNRVIDRRGARVVDDIDNIANYQIANLTTPVEVQQRSSLGAIEATINNTGELTGQQVVKFRIDGEPIRNESLRLSGGGSTTLDLSDRFVTLPIGTYQYTVQTDNDERTGELRVTEPDSGTTITSEDTNTTTTTSPLDDNEVPDEDDENTDPSGIFGLVGVSGRDVALGAALTGVAHVLGYWA